MRPRIGHVVVNSEGEIGFIMRIVATYLDDVRVFPHFDAVYNLHLYYVSSDLIYVGHGVWVES